MPHYRFYDSQVNYIAVSGQPEGEPSYLSFYPQYECDASSLEEACALFESATGMKPTSLNVEM